VLERVKAHLDLEATIGGYEAAERTEDEHERIYKNLARMLGCSAGEIALVDSSTRAWDAAFYAFAQRFERGDVILTASNEYVSNYIALLQMVRQRGVRIEVVPSETNGEISLPALEAAIATHKNRGKLIALTHVPTNGGLVQPAAAVGRIARRHGIAFLLDACQSAGQMPLNVAELGCDMLSATGRKYLRGPRGTGFLYVRQSLLEQLEPPMLDMRSANWTAPNQYEIRGDARRFETWEFSLACRLGMGVAVEYALALGLDRIQARVAALGEMLRGGLEKIPGITVRDLPGSGHPRAGIVTFTHARLTPQEIRARLSEQKINVWTTSTEGTRLDMEARNLTEMVRASVHYYNTEKELERVCRVLAAL
jgi:selenocysteine lyase/cysteine desulfurase